MPLYCKNKKITKAGFVGFGISNSQLYEILRNEYPELDYSFRLPIGKRESFMKTCYLGADFLKNIDILVDGPFILEKKNLELSFRGSSNQRIINVPLSLASNKIVLENYDSDNFVYTKQEGIFI